MNNKRENAKPNPDDRRDNVDRIQFNIDNTIKNYRETEDIIELTKDNRVKRELIEKNKRRKESLKNMKEEIREEAKAKEEGYR